MKFKVKGDSSAQIWLKNAIGSEKYTDFYAKIRDFLLWISLLFESFLILRLIAKVKKCTYSKGLNSRRAGLNKNGGLKFALFLKYVFKNRKKIQDFYEKYAFFAARRLYLDQADDY